MKESNLMKQWLIALVLLMIAGGVWAQSDTLPNIARTNILTVAYPNGWEVTVERGDVVAKSAQTNVLFDVYNPTLYEQANTEIGNLAAVLAYWYTPNDPSKTFDATLIRRTALGVYDEVLLYAYEDSFNDQPYERLIAVFALPNDNVVFASAVPRSGYALAERDIVLDMVSSASLPNVFFVTLRDGAIVGVLDGWQTETRTSERLVIADENTRLSLQITVRRDVQRERLNNYTRLLQRAVDQDGLGVLIDSEALERTRLSGVIALRYRTENTLYIAMFLKNGSGLVAKVQATGTTAPNETDALKILNNIIANAPRTNPLSTGAP